MLTLQIGKSGQYGGGLRSLSALIIYAFILRHLLYQSLQAPHSFSKRRLEFIYHEFFGPTYTNL